MAQFDCRRIARLFVYYQIERSTQGMYQKFDDQTVRAGGGTRRYPKERIDKTQRRTSERSGVGFEAKLKEDRD